MSMENKEGLPRASDLQRRINAIANIRALEDKGIHAHSLAKEIDPILGEEIAHLHDVKANGEGTVEPTFAQRNGIVTRKRSRRIISTLTKRHR